MDRMRMRPPVRVRRIVAQSRSGVTSFRAGGAREGSVVVFGMAASKTLGPRETFAWCVYLV